MPRLRSVAKLVRFSTEELARISERAQICGYTPARYIRETALGAIPKARHRANRDALLRELARVGRDLGRMARLAEMAGFDKFHAADRTRLLSALAAHQEALRSLVGKGCAESPAE
ncbi:MAG: hypothetical protein ABI142_06040 [Bryocella sp.]